jgi:hypothetical protein
METFKIKASSWIIYFLTLWVMLSLGAMFAIKILPGSNSLMIFIGLLILSVLIIRTGGIALTEWVLTEKEIQIKWLTQFMFHRRADLILRWDEIKGYQIRSERAFDLLKIVLTNGKVVRLWHDNLVKGDDFEKLLSRFLEQVKQHNYRKPSNDEQHFHLSCRAGHLNSYLIEKSQARHLRVILT